MKLELKHLAPYLPYETKVFYEDKLENLYGLKADMAEISIRRYPYISKELIQNIKPILRPLSDLTKEIEVNGETFVPYIELLRECNFDVDNMSIEELEYYKPDKNDLCLSRMYVEVVKLLEWQFDVFGLIEKGLAIDINTLKP